LSQQEIGGWLSKTGSEELGADEPRYQAQAGIFKWRVGNGVGRPETEKLQPKLGGCLPGKKGGKNE